MPLTGQLGDAVLGDMELGSDGSVPAPGVYPVRVAPKVGALNASARRFILTAAFTLQAATSSAASDPSALLQISGAGLGLD